MPTLLSVDELLSALRQVVTGQHSGKPLYFWNGTREKLQAALSALHGPDRSVIWLDVSTLAEDVIPKLARETLKRKLDGQLEAAIASGCSLLVIENPHLLLRYEPSAPFAAFWNSFVGSSRAVIVIVPQPVQRPPTLPAYVRFQGDRPEHLFVEIGGDSLVVSPDGGGRL